VNASAPFTNDRYDEEPYGEAEGIELSRVHISRTFSGDLEGSATAEILIAKSEGGGGYTGHDLVTGKLNGKSGGFVIQHGGIMGPAGISNTGTIVPRHRDRRARGDHRRGHPPSRRGGQPHPHARVRAAVGG
jgi:Protein of unknown function (DUF3224)